jgi:hypothetical protein
MKTKLLIPYISALLMIPPFSCFAGETSSIGYASVQQALAMLKRKPGVEVRYSDGWIIISQKGVKEMIVWSFAPVTHPAHPAVAKRTMYERDGGVYVDLSVLCEAGEPACGDFTEEFKKLDDQMVQATPGAPQEKPAVKAVEPWTPDAKQKAAADETARRYLKLRDEGRYQEAYELLAPGMQAMMPFMEWSRRSEEFRMTAGGGAVHENIKVSWHKDPPGAAHPGVYATFDLSCRYRNINFCTEILILHQQVTGEFRVLRHEQNIVDQETEKKLLEGTR